ncbi:outer membrane protein transport protein [uncultured Mailhella sp.]|uniref:OmpP1/FadL family transporter n=1 Tax=uncultured Mailhella sp. TaxID=1981031 RepID=UPI00262CDA06|nr:outer membrane protein transport protein [uncultured Mailhella sp.]
MNVSHMMRRLVEAVRGCVMAAGCVLALGGVFALAVPHAHAEGFNITEWSARGMALGGGPAGGMVARADDASAVAYNPAGITQIPGTSMQAGLAVSMLNFDLYRRDTGTTVSSSDQAWPIPHFYLTHQLSDRVWFGMGMFTRYGLGSQFPDNWGRPSPGTPGIPVLGGAQLTGVLKSVTLISSTLNPNIAVKLSDRWSVSAGVSYTWGYLSLNQQYNLGMNGTSVAGADARMHSENGYAFGFNFGLHARFNEQWSAGLTYRSREDMSFSGMNRFRFSGNSAYVGMLKSYMQSCSADGKLSVPDVITLGVMYKPLENLSFEADLGYTVWSRYRNLNINMHDAPPPQQFHEQKNWHDTWAFTLGVEYAPIDWMTLRAGFTYETSPLKNSGYPDYLVPSNGRNYYTLGAGFKYENWTLDLAYMYIDVRKLNYPGNSFTGPALSVHEGNCHNSYAHNFGVTLGYRF